MSSERMLEPPVPSTLVSIVLAPKRVDQRRLGVERIAGRVVVATARRRDVERRRLLLDRHLVDRRRARGRPALRNSVYVGASVCDGGLISRCAKKASTITIRIGNAALLKNLLITSVYGQAPRSRAPATSRISVPGCMNPQTGLKMREKAARRRFGPARSFRPPAYSFSGDDSARLRYRCPWSSP